MLEKEQRKTKSNDDCVKSFLYFLLILLPFLSVVRAWVAMKMPYESASQFMKLNLLETV